MKIIYYPQNDHLVIHDENGHKTGFMGRVAERILRRIILNDLPIQIGYISKKQIPNTKNNISTLN